MLPAIFLAIFLSGYLTRQCGGWSTFWNGVLQSRTKWQNCAKYGRNSGKKTEIDSPRRLPAGAGAMTNAKADQEGAFSAGGLEQIAARWRRRSYTGRSNFQAAGLTPGM
ncbi:MAG: hypothetical protein WA924_15095, partial [Burkholderiaceae bacterium]